MTAPPWFTVRPACSGHGGGNSWTPLLEKSFTIMQARALAGYDAGSLPRCDATAHSRGSWVTAPVTAQPERPPLGDLAP